MNISLEDCSNHSSNDEYQNETVQEISVDCFETSTLCDISDNVNTLPYNDSTINDTCLSSLAENDISSMSAPNPLCLNLCNKGMHIGHLNVQGLQNKFDQVALMLNSERNDIHVLGLSETKLKDFHPDDAFPIDNYQLFRKDRVITCERKEYGGGINVYVKEGIKCARRSDLETDEVECLFLEIFPNNGKSFLIGNLYRNPKESVQWNQLFEDMTEKVLKEEKETYFLGDFNRDLLNSQIKKSWLEYMEQFGLIQQVTVPTRQTEVSSTLIDHVYSNSPSNISSVTVPKVGLSDHYPIFLTRKINASLPKSSHYTIKYRSYKNFNEENFINELSSASWDVIKVFEDPDDILETWSTMFLDIVDIHLPVKEHRVKNKQQPKWLTPEIMNAMKTRDRYKSLNNDQEYKVWRNKVKQMIKKSKKMQYRSLIEENNSKPSNIWKIFKELGATKNKSKCTTNTISVDGHEYTDSLEIANEFNKFFVTVASKLKEPNLQPNFERLDKFCDERIPKDTEFSIPFLTREKVEKYLKDLDLSKATGTDDIGPRLLKLSAPFISDSITYICNKSIQNSEFPSKWKEGKVTPLFKNGTKEDVNNYRPISILPILSKIIEKHVHDSLMEFLNSFELLHKTQSGFRPNHSCETALTYMIDSWLKAINDDEIVGVVMVDFKKAFDLVDHNLLIDKLKHYRLSDTTIKWFSSYLIGRKQKVSIGNKLSDEERVLNGVPQGSILGPLMFLLFINDLPLNTDNVKTDLYADDTILHEKGKSILNIKNKLQISLNNLQEWCKNNGMVLNTAKTKVMLITTRQKRVHITKEDMTLTYNHVILNDISEDKILGVQVDDHLLFSYHIDKTAKKITSNIWLLSRIKDFLNTEHRVQFYKSFIQPHLDYCNIVWGATTQSNLLRLFRLQKRACKIFLDYNVDNIFESMKDLKIMTIYERIFFRKAKFMYKVSNSITPSYINDMFIRRTTNLALRSSTSINYIPPKPNKEIFKRSISYSGPLIWNSLPAEIRQAESMSSFHLRCINWMKGTQN